MDAALINAVPSLVSMELANCGRADVATVGATGGSLAVVTGEPPSGARATAAAYLPLNPRWARVQGVLAHKGLELKPTLTGIYIVKRRATYKPDTLPDDGKGMSLGEAPQ
jgi:hypothetical protein